jgi:hypothetical protein
LEIRNDLDLNWGEGKTMDYHLDRKVALSQESEYPSLYEWSLREHDDSGKQVGFDLVPWPWSLGFTATEMVLNEGLKLEVETPLSERLKPGRKREDGEEVKITTEESIRSQLRPGYFADRGESYSMFGADRTIKSFELSIYKRGEDETERCYVWGGLSYTTEGEEGQKETDDDVLGFTLVVSAERFAQYVKMMKSSPPNIMTLAPSGVEGFYSERSYSTTTNRIKVLTNLKDHQLTIPEGCAITPPTLGRVDTFGLKFVTRRDCDKPPRAVEPGDDGSPEGIAEKGQSSDEEALLLQRAALKLAVQQEQRMKYLSYAAWLIAGLLALLVLLVLRR